MTARRDNGGRIEASSLRFFSSINILSARISLFHLASSAELPLNHSLSPLSSSPASPAACQLRSFTQLQLCIVEARARRRAPGAGGEGSAAYEAVGHYALVSHRFSCFFSEAAASGMAPGTPGPGVPGEDSGVAV